MKSIARLLFIFLCMVGQSARSQSMPSRYGFIENKGQLMDQQGQPNTAVKYLFSFGGLNIQLRSKGFSYDTYRFSQQSPVKPAEESFAGQQQALPKVQAILYHRVDVEFVGANLATPLLAEQPLAHYNNYYTPGTPEQGVLGVRTWQTVTYKNLYPGIDLQFVSSEKQTPKYNFIIHPGADATQIRWKYLGAPGCTISKEQIILPLSTGKLIEKIPASYIKETGQALQVSYTKTENELYSFSIPKYNHATTLVIDPLPWATYFGGWSQEESHSVTADTAGNTIVGGWTSSADNIATSGAFQDTIWNGSSLFLAKFTPAGSLAWATYYGKGGEGPGKQMDIATAQNRDIILLGTANINGMASSGAYQTQLGRGQPNNADFILARFSTSGARIWATYYGGEGTETGTSVALDASGNIFFAGYTQSDSMATPGAYKTYWNGGHDMFIAKFSGSGFPIWCTYYGSTGDEEANALSIGPSGDVYIAGRTVNSPGLASPGAHKTTYNDPGMYKFEALLMRFSASGQRMWATYYGGSDVDEGFGVATDKQENVYLIGGTSSSSGIATSGTWQTLLPGGFSAFLVRFDSMGNRKWGTYYGGERETNPTAIATDESGNIYITGRTNSIAGVASYGAYRDTIYGAHLVWTSFDAFLSRFSNNGILQWGTYYGGEMDDEPYDLALSPPGFACITGRTWSMYDIASPGAFKEKLDTGWHYGSCVDIFLSAFTLKGSLSPGITGNVMDSSVQCFSTVTDTLKASAAGGGNGIYRYRWIRSVTSPASGYAPAGGNDSIAWYIPPSVSNTTWFRRVVYSGGNIDSSAPVIIQPQPHAGFTAGSISQCLTGNSFTLNDTSWVIHPYSRKWYFGTNPSDTSSLAAPVKNYTQAGSYTVKLVVQTSYCRDSTTQNLTVYPAASTGFSMSDTAQCLSEMFVFTDTSSLSSGSFTRQWLPGDSSTLTSAVVNQHYHKAGNYSVKLRTITSQGCIDSAVKNIRVYPQPKAGFTTNNPVQCLKGNLFNFTDISNISNGSYTRLWTLDASDTSSFTLLQRSFDSTGLHQVRLLIVSEYGCSDTAWQTLTVNPSPRAGIQPVGPLPLCTGGSVHLYADSNSDLNYRWLRNDLPIAASGPSVKLFTSGNFSVVVRNGFACSDTSPVVQVQAVAVPIISGAKESIAYDQVNYSVQPAPGSTYTWQISNGKILSGQNSNRIQVQWGHMGYGRLLLIAKNNSCTDTVWMQVGIIANDDIIFYPNPAFEYIGMRSGQNLYGATVSLTNMLGQRLFSSKISTESYELVLSLNSYASGPYILSVSTSGGSHYFKFVKLN